MNMKQYSSINKILKNNSTRRKAKSDLLSNVKKQKHLYSKKQLPPLTTCFTIINFISENNQTQLETKLVKPQSKDKEEKKTKHRNILPKLFTMRNKETIKLKPIVIIPKQTSINKRHQTDLTTHPSLYPPLLIKKTKASYNLKAFHSLSQPGGRNDQKKENQDAILINFKVGSIDSYHCFGVFDGHGDHGARISNECSQFFSNYFASILNNNNKVSEIQTTLTENSHSKVKEAFSSVENYLLNHYIDTSFSGSSANIILLIEDLILCANAGDSRSIVVTESNTIIPLSIDNKPELPEEKQRILQAQGRVDRIEGMSHGPYRVWKQSQEYPGLAMSRSIGDSVAHQIGVISEPNVTQYSLKELKPKFIICATDGIWDCITNSDAMTIIDPFYSSNNPIEAANALAIKAKTTWKEINNNNYDDISVIVLFF